MLSAPRKLGRGARAALARVEGGRDEGWVRGLHFVPLDLDQLDEFTTLAALRDPFDRLVVSAARRLRAKLISRDEEVDRSGLVDVVWS